MDWQDRTFRFMAKYYEAVVLGCAGIVCLAGWLYCACASSEIAALKEETKKVTDESKTLAKPRGETYRELCRARLEDLSARGEGIKLRLIRTSDSFFTLSPLAVREEMEKWEKSFRDHSEKKGCELPERIGPSRDIPENGDGAAYAAQFVSASELARLLSDYSASRIDNLTTTVSREDSRLIVKLDCKCDIAAKDLPQFIAGLWERDSAIIIKSFKAERGSGISPTAELTLELETVFSSEKEPLVARRAAPAGI